MLFTCSLLFSQQIRTSHEIGMFAGISYYLGELNNTHFKGFYPSSEYNTDRSVFIPATGIVYRRNAKGGRIAWKSSFLYGYVEGFDAKTNNNFQVNRNLGFYSDLFELSSQIEINYFKLDPFSTTDLFSPYVFTGLSILWMDPKGVYNDQWASLQPLQTEGYDYKLTQIAIPLGIGVKWMPTTNLSVSLEWGMRKTFTDYMDDVSNNYVDPDVLDGANDENTNAALYANPSLSGDDLTNRQRGNSVDKDWYNFTGFTISWLITKQVDICPEWND